MDLIILSFGKRDVPSNEAGEDYQNPKKKHKMQIKRVGSQPSGKGLQIGLPVRSVSIHYFSL